MITGHNADALERHLEGCGLTFIRNERYATTQMFDSAALGLNYLKDKCGRILFTPVDVPLDRARPHRFRSRACLPRLRRQARTSDTDHSKAR